MGTKGDGRGFGRPRKRMEGVWLADRGERPRLPGQRDCGRLGALPGGRCCSEERRMRNVGVLCLAATLTASAAAAVPVNFAHELIKGTVETFDDLAPGVGDGNGPIFYDGFSVTTGHRALGAGFGRSAVPREPVPANVSPPRSIRRSSARRYHRRPRSSLTFPRERAASGCGCRGRTKGLAAGWWA